MERLDEQLRIVVAKCLSRLHKLFGRMHPFPYVRNLVVATLESQKSSLHNAHYLRCETF